MEAMMNKLLMFCAGALLLLSGCATDPASRPWWSLGEADFRGLQAGVTTQSEVLKRLGTPLQRANFERVGEEVWDYRYLDGTREMIAWVTFDRQGKYKNYVGQPDPARYSGMDR